MEHEALNPVLEPVAEDPMVIEGRKRRKRAKAMRIVGKTGSYLFLTALSLFFLFPFLVMICLSILSNKEILQQVLFSPTGTIYLGTYRALFSSGSTYLRYLLNTLYVAAITTVGIPRMNWRMRKMFVAPPPKRDGTHIGNSVLIHPSFA